MNKMWVINKRLLVGIIIVLAILAYFIINVKAGESYTNCTEVLRATGRTHFLKGDKLYSASMDRDSDGISCE